MKGASFKTKVSESVEKNTIDKVINTKRQTEDEFISKLLSFTETDVFTNALKEKAEKEQALYEESQAKIQAEKEEKEKTEGEGEEKAEGSEGQEGSENTEGSEAPKNEKNEETAIIERVVAKPVVSADEIKPELVEYIKSELMEKMQTERTSVITEFINGRAVSQEEFYKLQLLSCFPLLGIPMYFFFLVVLSTNRTNKYAVSIQNYAKSQLRTFWIYLLAHSSVLFVAGASLTSLINIIQRGLGA